MAHKQNNMKERERELAWGIAYCLAYDRDFDGVALESLKQLVIDDPMPQGAQGDETTIIAEVARRIVSDEQETYPIKEELRRSRLSQLSGWLNNPDIAVVMGGATKIKQYVFESIKLPEIRGASGLLDRINLRDAPALFSSHPFWLTDLQNGSGVNEQEIKEARQIKENVREAFERRYGIEPPDCEECVIYANGGELLSFAPLKLAELLAEAIERLYTNETLVANSVAVWRPCSLMELRFGLHPLEVWAEDITANESLRDLLYEYGAESDPDSFRKRKVFGEIADALALEKLRRREGNQVDNRPPRPTILFETCFYVRRCQSCEIRNSVVERRLEDEPVGDWFCEPCARKRAFGQKAKKDGEKQTKWFKRANFDWEPLGARAWVNIFDEWLHGHEELEQAYYRGTGVQEAQAPNDLEDIAAAAKPEGFIGVIYADGNGMGSILEELKTPAEYQKFAEAVYETIKETSFTAIAKHLQPHELNGKWMHPFEVLSIGGDDVFMIVPAHAALPIAISIAELVEARLSQRAITQAKEDEDYEWRQVHRIARPANLESLKPQSRVSLSSGVAIADHHTPILFLRQLVEELLKSAKKKARKLKQKERFFGATIDFVVLKSIGMIANNIRDFRESALRRNYDHLTAKPYTVPELKELLKAAKTLKNAAFPRTQIYRLRKQIEKGWLASSVDYLYFRERLPKEHAETMREAIDKTWTGYKQDGREGRVGDIGLWLRRMNDEWEMTETERETFIGDLAEIYDFVP